MKIKEIATLIITKGRKSIVISDKRDIVLKIKGSDIGVYGLCVIEEGFGSNFAIIRCKNKEHVYHVYNFLCDIRDWSPYMNKEELSTAKVMSICVGEIEEMIIP